MAAVRTALDELGTNGAFKRTAASFRNSITSTGGQFPAEVNRYHLYVSYACPWAHRTLIVRALKGLQDVISVTVVHPTWQKTSTDPDDKHVGWIFGDPNGKPLVNNMGAGGPFPACYPGNEPDPILGVKSIRELYERASDTNGKYSVPVLWDKKQGTIVSNESSDIIEMFNSQFNQFAKNPDLDLSPQETIQDRKAVDDWIYPNINDGVYRCGFATTQAAYDIAIEHLTNAFDKVEKILERQRYIAGDGSALTLSDIRLFVTLLRFDPVYIVYFKTNTRSVTHSPALLNYCRDIYQMPGVAETVNLEQIKVHYFTSHPRLNYLSIIPRGTDFEALLKEPHNRMDLDVSVEGQPTNQNPVTTKKRGRDSDAATDAVGSDATEANNQD